MRGGGRADNTNTQRYGDAQAVIGRRNTLIQYPHAVLVYNSNIDSTDDLLSRKRSEYDDLIKSHAGGRESESRSLWGKIAINQLILERRHGIRHEVLVLASRVVDMEEKIHDYQGTARDMRPQQVFSSATVGDGSNMWQDILGPSVGSVQNVNPFLSVKNVDLQKSLVAARRARMDDFQLSSRLSRQERVERNRRRQGREGNDSLWSSTDRGPNGSDEIGEASRVLSVGCVVAKR